MHSDYLSFFGLNDHPFRLTPDTRYFFPSSKHKAVLEVMKYGIQRGEGFIVVTGDPGSGKTMLLRVLLKELDPTFETALIIAPTLEPKELLQAILEDIGIDFNPSDTKERLVKKFRDYLIDLVNNGKRLLLVIDEAQNLPLASIEEIRLLSNLELEDRKLFQILLVGQPSLESKLKSPELSQFAQRISVWERVSHLSLEETVWYIQHRLGKAGGSHIPLEKGAEKILHRATQGIPRLINKVMDRSLLVMAAKIQRRLTKEVIKEAIRSLGPTLDDDGLKQIESNWITIGLVSLAILVIAFIGVIIWWFLGKRS